MTSFAVEVTRKSFVSLLMAAGVLAIANVDSVLPGHGPTFYEVKEAPKYKAKASPPGQQNLKNLKVQFGLGLDRLRNSFAEDEFNDEKPFVALIDAEALNLLGQKGVKHFVRQAYRSPQYKNEFGYDRLHYAIEHEDGSHSLVLAYLEGSSPVVSVFVGEGSQSRNFLFRSGQLVDRSNLPVNQAQLVVNQKIEDSVPFLSLSR